MVGGCELLWDRGSGDSKANYPSGWVCLLGEVLDFCGKRSCETVSEMFDVCENISWDVAAEILLLGVRFCKARQTVFGGMVAKRFRSACFELQRMCFLEC